MVSIDRRRFLFAGAAAAASLRGLAQSAAAPAPYVAKLALGDPGPAVPANFVGLSYETQQLSDPSFFSPANSGLIAQFRALAPHGVLRIGGNTSDVGWWKPTPATPMPPLPGNVVLTIPSGERPPLDLAYAVTPEAVRNLRGFLDATGWTCLYGIDLGTNTPALAAEQAVFVAKTLGATLEYFQLGNEPDHFPNRFRVRATWTANAYLDEWLAAANAVRARVPEARFGMPDIAGVVDWLAPIADRLAALPGAPPVAAISHHYYFSGPPSNPKVNINDLLHDDPRVAHDAGLARAAAMKLHTRWRMTEGNTCNRGGKPGVSDVFAAALWSADYLLKLAWLGYAGVNLHGGDGQMVANSLGGRLPGDDLVADDPATHPHPYYTPIAHFRSGYVAEPVSFGMRFAGRFSGATMVAADFDPGPVNATAYAAKGADGDTLIAIVNKDSTQGVTVPLPSAAHRWYSTSADALDATTVREGQGTGPISGAATVGPHTMFLLTGFKRA